jgi:ABC-2 type transport system permease protein
MHSIRIYLLYFVQFLKARLSYRMDFFSGLVASLFSAIGGVVFIFLLLDGKAVSNLKGWDREQVLFIYGYSLIATSLFGLISVNLYRFSDKYIIEGQFDRVLLRPLNSLFQVLFESFNLESIGALLLGVGILFYAASGAQLSFGFADILWLVVSLCSGAVILVAVFTTVATASFHFEDRLGLVPPVYNLVSFSRYPLPIFNRFLQIFLSWIIPFAFVSFYPATHFFGPEKREALAYASPLVALVSSGIAALFWRMGVAKYSSTGS